MRFENFPVDYYYCFFLSNPSKHKRAVLCNRSEDFAINKILFIIPIVFILFCQNDIAQVVVGDIFLTLIITFINIFNSQWNSHFSIFYPQSLFYFNQNNVVELIGKFSNV